MKKDSCWETSVSNHRYCPNVHFGDLDVIQKKTTCFFQKSIFRLPLPIPRNLCNLGDILLALQRAINSDFQVLLFLTPARLVIISVRNLQTSWTVYSFLANILIFLSFYRTVAIERQLKIVFFLIPKIGAAKSSEKQLHARILDWKWFLKYFPSFVCFCLFVFVCFLGWTFFGWGQNSELASTMKRTQHNINKEFYSNQYCSHYYLYWGG